MLNRVDETLDSCCFIPDDLAGCAPAPVDKAEAIALPTTLRTLVAATAARIDHATRVEEAPPAAQNQRTNLVVRVCVCRTGLSASPPSTPPKKLT